MFFRFFFRQWPLQKQACYLIKKGVFIGNRTKDSRKIYIYMYRDHFGQIIFNNDNPNDGIEQANIVKGLQNLNNHLENEFRTTF